MTPDGWSIWFLFFVFIISIYVIQTAKITCFTSDHSSAGPTCEGDYCTYVESCAIREPVRGCLSGNLLKPNIVDQCERNSLEKKHVCVCSSNGCNFDTSGIRHQSQTKLLECYHCVKNCSAETTCYGEYCTLTKYPNGRIVRGCGSASGLLLFERKRLGSCVTPSFPAFTEKPSDWDPRAVTCTCNDRKFCNGRLLTMLVRPEKNTERCPVRSIASTRLGTFTTPSVPDCEGEQCYNISITMGDVTTNVSGCISFLQFGSSSKSNNGTKLQRHKDMNDRGCMTLESESIRAEACFFDTEMGRLNETSRGRGDDEVEDGTGDDVIAERTRIAGPTSAPAPNARQSVAFVAIMVLIVIASRNVF